MLGQNSDWRPWYWPIVINLKIEIGTTHGWHGWDLPYPYFISINIRLTFVSVYRSRNLYRIMETSENLKQVWWLVTVSLLSGDQWVMLLTTWVSPVSVSMQQVVPWQHCLLLASPRISMSGVCNVYVTASSSLVTLDPAAHMLLNILTMHLRPMCQGHYVTPSMFIVKWLLISTMCMRHNEARSIKIRCCCWGGNKSIWVRGGARNSCVMTRTWQETAGDSNVSTGDIGAEPREGHSGASRRHTRGCHDVSQRKYLIQTFHKLSNDH